jgi:hypothetical protein
MVTAGDIHHHGVTCGKIDKVNIAKIIFPTPLKFNFHHVKVVHLRDSHV